jgi:hypothetical protein
MAIFIKMRRNRERIPHVGDVFSHGFGPSLLFTRVDDAVKRTSELADDSKY